MLSFSLHNKFAMKTVVANGADENVFSKKKLSEAIAQ